MINITSHSLEAPPHEIPIWGLRLEVQGINVFKDGYLKAMNCEDIRYAKKMLVYKAKEKENIPCTSCYLYKKLKKSNITLTEEDINGQTPIY